MQLYQAPVGKWRVSQINAVEKVRRRLAELGVWIGAEIEVKGRAPFGGGVEILACGRLIGIRAATARFISVCESAPFPFLKDPCWKEILPQKPSDFPNAQHALQTPQNAPERLPTVALLGTPNAGKSTLYNALTGAHARVGNYTGVTVGVSGATLVLPAPLKKDSDFPSDRARGVPSSPLGSKTRSTKGKGRRITLCDLPGTYSLSGFSKEEQIALQFLRKTPLSALVLVTECALLPRSRPFLLQARSLGIPTLIALNMADEFKARGGKADEAKLTRYFGAPVLVISARKGKDVRRVKQALSDLLEENDPSNPTSQPTQATRTVQPDQTDQPIQIAQSAHSAAIARSAHLTQPTQAAFGGKSARFAPTASAVSSEFEGTYSPRAAESPSFGKDDRLFQEGFFLPPQKERFFVRQMRKPWFAFLLFAVLLFAVFYAAFGTYGPGTLLKNAAERLQEWLLSCLTSRIEGYVAPVLTRFLVEGVLSGVGSVLCFLPQLAVLFSLVTLLEESGVLSRLAFFTDGLFSRIGLSGRAVFCMLLGYGCTAAALSSTRGMESAKGRKKTALLLPFLPCSARMPAFTLLVSFFFSGNVWVILILYCISLLLSFGVLCVVNRRYPTEKEATFLIEFPPYRIPTLRNFGKALLNYLRSFIIKVGTTVFLTVTFLSALTLFTPTLRVAPSVEESLLAALSKRVVFLFYPMGITDWRFFAAAATGIVAKESVAATLVSLFPNGFAGTISSLSAFSYLLFLALYPPCVAALSACAKEFGVKFASASFILQTALSLAVAYGLPLLVRAQQLVPVPLFFVQIAIFCAIVYLLFRKNSHEKNSRKKSNHPQVAV